MKTLDAKNQIVGRVVSVAAKQALLGQQVSIVNCEQAVIAGNKQDILARYRQRIARGQPNQGPYISRRPERIVKRMVRGMLPYKKERGRAAFLRVKCYEGMPPEAGGEPLTLKGAGMEKLPHFKYMTLKQLCALIRK